MRILYLGGDSSPPPDCTSWHRAMALVRIGASVHYIVPHRAIRWNRVNSYIHFRTGYRLLNRKVERYVLSEAARNGPRFDLIWVDGGELICGRLLSLLRRDHAPILINYNCDDPTGRRDGARWATFLRSISQYDLSVVVREEGIREYPIWGAKRVFRVFRSADEVAHAPRAISADMRAKWASEVAFVGTWLPERGPFLVNLIRAGVPLSIWGNRWQKAPEWRVLRSFWRGPHLFGDNYAYAIQCAKVNLGLLSKGNRDQHTTRSAEIPYLGSVFCGEDTGEHRSIFQHRRDAMLFSDDASAAAHCMWLLANDDARSAMAREGRKRIIEAGMLNQSVLRGILTEFQLCFRPSDDSVSVEF